MVDYNHSPRVTLWYGVGGLALHSNKSCSFPSMDQQFLGPKSSAKSFHHKQNEGGKKPAGHQHLISPQEVSGTSTWHYGATPSARLTVLLQEHICYLLHLSKAMGPAEFLPFSMGWNRNHKEDPILTTNCKDSIRSRSITP